MNTDITVISYYIFRLLSLRTLICLDSNNRFIFQTRSLAFFCYLDARWTIWKGNGGWGSTGDNPPERPFESPNVINIYVTCRDKSVLYFQNRPLVSVSQYDMFSFNYCEKIITEENIRLANIHLWYKRYKQIWIAAGREGG